MQFSRLKLPDLAALVVSEERALALRLMRLPEVLTQLEDDLLPSRLIAAWNGDGMGCHG